MKTFNILLIVSRHAVKYSLTIAAPMLPLFLILSASEVCHKRKPEDRFMAPVPLQVHQRIVQQIIHLASWPKSPAEAQRRRLLYGSVEA